MKRVICRSCLSRLGSGVPPGVGRPVAFLVRGPRDASPRQLRQELTDRTPCDWCALFEEHPPVKHIEVA